MFGRCLCARALLATGLGAATSVSGARAATTQPEHGTSAAQRAQIAEHYAKIPLGFEAHQRQADANTEFFARGSGYRLDLTGDGAVLALCHADGRNSGPADEPSPPSTVCDAMHMQLLGASSAAKPVGEQQLPGTANYFLGNDRAKWRTGIPTYARVRYRNIYPGIDLVYYGNQRQLEYDFELAPGADAKRIGMRLDGAVRLCRAANGDLMAKTAGGTLTLRRPAIYQIVDGRRIPVAGEFALAARHTVRFRLGRYDRTKPLVIDPQLVYSTFLGGSGDPNAALLGSWGSAIAVDAEGNAYVTGSTLSTNFPVTQGAFQGTDPGAENQIQTAFVSKLNASGTALVYSTYLGGNGYDGASAIAVDADGDAYVTGNTGSLNFPVTAGVLQSANKGAGSGTITAFVTELNPSGTGLIYSTYLGGSTYDGATAIAVDADGNAYVTGSTLSTDFPVTAGAFQTTNKAAAAETGNAFVAKLNAGGTALVYSTYLGGSGGARTSLGGCLSAAGSTLNEDGAFAIAVDAAGDAYIAGEAISSDFPVTNGAFQTQNNAAAGQTYNAFVAKLNPAGSALIYSTYLGGSGLPQCGSETALSPAGDAAFALSVDDSGDAYVAGVAFSQNFPVTLGALQTTDGFSYKGVHGPTAFVTKLNPSGSALVYSTYLGGSGGFIDFTPDFALYGGDAALGLAIDTSGDAYVTGATASLNFPVTAGAYQTANASANGSGGAFYNAFVTVINSTGDALIYSTYVGGNGSNPNVESSEQAVEYGDESAALALDGSGNVYLTGTAESATFPVTGGAFQPTIPAFTSAFVSKLALGTIVAAPGFTIAGTPVTVVYGSIVGTTSTITVTPTGGFTGSVALTAAITSEPAGAVNPPTFSFGSTSPVNITGASAGTATLTVSASSGGTCPIVAGDSGRKLPWQIPSGATLAVLVLAAVPRRRRSTTWLALALLLSCLATGVSGCGSSATSSQCTGTTTGTYTVTVTGTSGATTESGTVMITVEPPVTVD